MDLGQTGAYFAWISSQFPGDAWLACTNPATVILYSGAPHKATGLWLEDRGGGVWRLHWKAEIYGTWLDQIIVWQDGVGWVETQGPDGFGFWHFVDYGGLAYDPAKASFVDGWADFTLPPRRLLRVLPQLPRLGRRDAGRVRHRHLAVTRPAGNHRKTTDEHGFTRMKDETGRSVSIGVHPWFARRA